MNITKKECIILTLTPLFLIFLKNTLLSQVYDWTTVSPRVIFEGAHFNGLKGVKGLHINIDNLSVPIGYPGRSASNTSVCDHGLAIMNIQYHTGIGDNEYDVYLSAPQSTNGIDGVDVLKINQYLNNFIQFDNYQYLAADADQNGVVDTTDKQLWQKLILQQITMPLGEYWFAIRNIDKHNFENNSQNSTLYDWGVTGDHISVYDDPAGGSGDNLFSFRVVKRGDVNGSNCYNCWNNCTPPSFLNIPNEVNFMTNRPGQNIIINLNINTTKGISGVQWFKTIDKNFNILEVKSNVPGFSKNDYSFQNDTFRLLSIPPISGDGNRNERKSLNIEVVLQPNSTYFEKIIYGSIENLYLKAWDGNLDEISDIQISINNNHKNYNRNLTSNAYPNPVINNLTIQHHSNYKSETTVSIYNSNGQNISNYVWNIDKGVNKKSIDFTNYPAGFYYINGVDKLGQSFSYKIVK